MNFNISILNDNGKRMYLIQINEESATWSIEKRFSEILKLKEDLSRQFGQHFKNFPKKRLTNHYREDVIKKRLCGINIFFTNVSLHNEMINSSIFQNFIRSDIQLETLEDLKQSEQIKSNFCKSKELEEGLIELENELNFLNDDISEVVEKSNTLNENIKKLKLKNCENIAFFNKLKELKVKNNKEKNLTIENLSELDNTYITLKRQIILVKILQSQSFERLGNMLNTVNKLDKQLLDINQVICKVDDTFITNKFKLENLQRINDIYLNKIKGELENLNIFNLKVD